MQQYHLTIQNKFCVTPEMHVVLVTRNLSIHVMLPDTKYKISMHFQHNRWVILFYSTKIVIFTSYSNTVFVRFSQEISENSGNSEIL